MVVRLSLCLLLPASLLLSPLAFNLNAAEKTILLQDSSTACSDAADQAKRDVSGGTWFMIGCLAGIIGVLIAQMENNPPAMALLGKSQEYVAAYTDCYRKETKSIKSKNAITGCLVFAGIYAVIFAIAASSGNADNE